MGFFKDIAMPLLERGFRVMPLLPREKRAFLPDWPTQAANASRRTIEQWDAETPNANVGVVARLGGLCILDDDTGALAERIEKEIGLRLSLTYTVKTAKGFHYYFQHSEKSMVLSNAKLAGVFDFQADRKYVVGPGSIHPSGAVYTLVNNASVLDIPNSLVEWMAANQDQPKQRTIEAAAEEPGPTLHEDFEALDWIEHYDLTGTWDDDFKFHMPCPWKGDYHTTEGKPDFTTTTIFWDKEQNIFGFKCQATSCEGSNHTISGLIDFLNKDHEPYPEPIWEEQEIDLPEGLVEDVESSSSTDDDAWVAPASATPQAEGETLSSSSDKFWAEVKQSIVDLRAIPGREMPMWKKKQLISEVVYKALRKTGRLYNVGNIAAWLNGEDRELIEVVKNGPLFGNLLYSKFGIYSSDRLADDIGLHLGQMIANEPSKELYAGSYYDIRKHVLYVNEWAGNILKIDGQGNVTRIKNGDDGLLWNDGELAKADPLHAELPVPEAKALALDGLIKSDILDTILYDETMGVKKDQSQLILMTAILGLFFVERIPAYPYVFFFGPGGSMKTSLATKIGKLVTGASFRPTPATTNEDELKIMAINNSFLLLDEANKLRKLQDVMKAIGTGAQDVRRELYTTTAQRVSSYKARIWMTANVADPASETVSSRMMLIDAAARTEKDPYRSTHDVNMDWDGGVRDKIWTELIARLAAAMRALAKAPRNIRVSHRMSDFFVFGMAIAKADGIEGEMKKAMDAMEARQTSSVAGTDIIGLLKDAPRNFNGIAMSAKEWANVFATYVVPESNYELRKKASSQHWVTGQLMSYEKTLKDSLGMKKESRLTKQKNYQTLYSFTGCDGAPVVMPDDPNFAPATPVEEKPVKKDEPKFCECKGCKHCDPKGGPRKCARHSKKDKCSQCRSTIPADLVDDLRADAVPAKAVTRPNDVKGTMAIFDIEELN